MADSLVSRIYGDALFEAAGEAGKRKQVLEEIQCMAELVETSPQLQEFLRSPAIPAEEKKAFTGAALRDVFSSEMVNFLFVLIDKERIWHIGRIARRYKVLYDREMGVSTGKIYSAVPLTEQQVSESAEAVSGLFQKKVLLENQTDPDLLGGVKIQVDGKLIDRSLRGELSRLQQSLREQ